MKPMPQFFKFSPIETSVCRLGLATRGNTVLGKEDVMLALEHGINYWNWCGHRDGMSQAIRELGSRRNQTVIAIQLSAREYGEARRELEETLVYLKTPYIDIVTIYYVEALEEWERVISSSGTLRALEEAREEGFLRMIGLTTHQRPLAAQILTSRRLDLLMLRYNAAHRGAEKEVFPLARRLGVPLVSFTGLRWKALLSATQDDPPNFVPPRTREWYRFVLSHPAVSVALMAPNGRKELVENLELLADWRPPTSLEDAMFREHGDRVRRHVGSFP